MKLIHLCFVFVFAALSVNAFVYPCHREPSPFSTPFYSKWCGSFPFVVKPLTPKVIKPLPSVEIGKGAINDYRPKLPYSFGVGQRREWYNYLLNKLRESLEAKQKKEQLQPKTEKTVVVSFNDILKDALKKPADIQVISYNSVIIRAPLDRNSTKAEEPKEGENTSPSTTESPNEGTFQRKSLKGKLGGLFGNKKSSKKGPKIGLGKGTKGPKKGGIFDKLCKKGPNGKRKCCRKGRCSEILKRGLEGIFGGGIGLPMGGGNGGDYGNQGGYEYVDDGDDGDYEGGNGDSDDDFNIDIDI